MSDTEKDLVERVAKLPEPLRARFLDQVKGAAMALDILEEKAEKQEEEQE